MHQDWDTVVFKKNIKTEKKISPVNPNRETSERLNKLDNNNADHNEHKITGKKIGKLIQQGRLAKHLSQKQLANKLNIKTSILTDYESGTAIIRDNRLLQKIKNVLGIKN